MIGSCGSLCFFDLLQAREYLSKLGELSQTQIFAKIENIEVSSKFRAWDYLLHTSILYIDFLFPIVLLKFDLYIFLLLQGLTHFDEILQEADGIILSRGNLGIDLPPEKVSYQKNDIKIGVSCI